MSSSSPSLVYRYHTIRFLFRTYIFNLVRNFILFYLQVKQKITITTD